MSTIITIIIFTIFIFVILIIIHLLNIDLNPSYPPPKLIQEVLVENMDSNPDLINEVNNLKLLPIDSFCESYLGKSHKLENACNRLTKDKCIKTKCCVYQSNNKCVAGDRNGATYKDENDLFPIDFYYYNKKCYGNC